MKLTVALTSTIKNLIGYMSLTYSITGLLIILGVAGKYTLAAEVAIIQAALQATFYVLSGDARHLILNGQVHQENVMFFRLSWLLPLAAITYLMAFNIGSIEYTLVLSFIVRRCAEWLAEVHVTYLERQEIVWQGWLIQPALFLLLICQLLLTEQTWLIWIWAISPVAHSLQVIWKTKKSGRTGMRWEYLTSSMLMGFTGYLIRVFIVGVAGKELSGMLFPGYAVGSFIGTMAATVIGPTLFRKKQGAANLIRGVTAVLALMGVAIFFASASLLYQAVGLSVIGGAVMISAQQSRLFSLVSGYAIQADLLYNLLFVLTAPLIYFMFGVEWLSANYLAGCLVAWLFYEGNIVAMKVNFNVRRILLVSIVLGLIAPVFFQLAGGIYNQYSAALLDSGGNMQIVPLPIGIAACCIGVVLFTVEFKKTMPVVLMMAATFLLLICSIMFGNQGNHKIVLLIQNILPMVGLLLGVALADFDRKLIAKVILYFLMIFVPLQLLATWTQQQLALTHYLYIFSVYQHYQYVPLVMVSLFTWVWVELRDENSKQIYLLAPWMAFYVAAGNSTLALFGLLIFAVVFAIPYRKKLFDLLIPVVIVVGVMGYFTVNAQLASDIHSHNEAKNILRYGLFEDKFLDKQGHFLYKANTANTANTEIPINILDRIKFASIYLRGFVDHPLSILVGHDTPPPREIASSAHNYYLDLIYNFGLLACAPILVLLIYTVRGVIQVKSIDNSIVWLLAIVLYAVAIDSNFKVTLRQPYPGMIAFFMWGIILNALYKHRQILEQSQKDEVIL